MTGSRSILISNRASDRIAAARRWLLELPAGGEAIVLAPLHAAADDLVRACAAERPAVVGMHRMTLNRLAGLLAADRIAELGLLAAAGTLLRSVAAIAAFDLRQDGNWFTPIADQPGFADALARTIEELRLAGIDAKRLRTIGLGGAELGAIMTRFDERLRDSALVDRSEILRIATKAIDADPPPRFAVLPTILLDVPIGSAAESAFVAALAARAPRILATVPTGDERSARALSDALSSPVAACPRHDEARSSSLERLQAYLFKDDAVEFRDLDETVAIVSAPGEMHECVEVARRILAEARRGVAFDQIAVLMNEPRRYRPFLEEALVRGEIPAHFALEESRPALGGRALLVLLECAAENLSARRFCEYLSLAQVPVEPECESMAPSRGELSARSLFTDLDPSLASGESSDSTPSDAPAPWRWERLIVDAAVIGGAERWSRRLDLHESALRARRAELKEGSPASVGVDRALSDIAALRRFAIPLISMLADLPVVAPWGEWLGRIADLTRVAIRQRADLNEVLRDLAPMTPLGPVGLADVRIALTRRLADLKAAAEPRRPGQVFVSSPNRARGMSFRVVIVAGLAERIFPQKLTEDPILLDSARAALDPGLDRNEDRARQQRLALLIAAGAASERVMFSWPRVDLEQGRPRVPSFYALEVVRAASGRLPGFDELARIAATAQSARLGWPAPSDAALAIDDAEFDLAVLGDILGSDPETTRGAAHYLLDANEFLGRALRGRARRWLRRWTPADGLVDPDAPAVAALARHQLKARSYSPTALQNFAGCPYRFFLQAIHRLEPREEPAALEVIDPLTRGGLFAEVQYEILSELRRRGELPVTESSIEAASRLLDSTLQEVAARWHDEFAPAIERVWLDAIESIRADLREWLRRAADDPEHWCPAHFELSFGLAGREQADPASSPNPVALEGGLALRGSIDLVERDPQDHLRVTDHKTGRVRAKNRFVIGGGKHLQPVFYALAAERILGRRIDAGRLYYCTAAGGYEERVVEINDTARDAARSFVATIDSALATGFLPAAPADGECEWCDYRRVCGPYEERRVRDVKPASRLKALEALRKIP